MRCGAAYLGGVQGAKPAPDGIITTGEKGLAFATRSVANAMPQEVELFTFPLSAIVQAWVGVGTTPYRGDPASPLLLRLRPADGVTFTVRFAADAGDAHGLVAAIDDARANQ